MLKHKLVVLVSLVVLVAAGVFAVHQYDVQHHRQVVSETRAKAAAWVAQRKANYQKSQQAAQLNALKVQCASDHAKYVAETPAQRVAKTSVTDCNPALVSSQF